MTKEMEPLAWKKITTLRKRVLADEEVTSEEYAEVLTLLRGYEEGSIKHRLNWLEYRWLDFWEWFRYMLAKIGK